MRSRTRFSSASAASTLGVTSVKVVTMPPSGMRLARTSSTRPRPGEALEERLGSGRIALKPVAHQFLDVARSENTALGMQPQNLVQPGADRRSCPAADREFRRTAGSSRRVAGPCRTPRCPRSHGRARSAGFRDCNGSRHWHRRAAGARPGRDVALAQQQRQHEARRRRADRGGEQMLGMRSSSKSAARPAA